MTTFDVAHILEQGQNMIIVPMRSDFRHKSDSDQASISIALQTAARSAGLAGQVVTVWDAGSGRMGFRGPKPWHGFLGSISLQWVAANINKRITIN
ncbi:MAG: hypothetical protein V4550_09115 [Gemmatimonadota bacterium]